MSTQTPTVVNNNENNMTIFRIAGGAFLILYAASLVWTAIPAIILAFVAAIAGIALLAGK